MSNALRHITSINDLDNPEIERVFGVAKKYLEEFGVTTERTEKSRAGTTLKIHRIGRSGRFGTGSILASLFYEPSTRTRLSFESAMLRLGGGTITSADPATSSAAKGESLADTVRVVSNYADAIVIRHPRDGAAKLAAQYATVPIINGGDGSHEHPTQTLCDLFTLYREKGKIKNLNVAISGDLKGSRTIHSFVYALARFGAYIRLVPGAKGMELPAHVYWRLRNEFNCQPLPKDKYDLDDSVDVLYVTAQEPHQLSLISDPDVELNIKVKKGIDVVYVTRFQKERWNEYQNDYMKIDSNYLRGSEYRKTSVLHPLPRVGELDISLDQNPRAAYFQQAAYGVPIRMALIALLLDFDQGPSLEKFETGFNGEKYAIYEHPSEVGMRCPNHNCIANDKNEGQYTANKFYVVPAEPPRLRCFYCETDVENFVVAHRKSRHYGARDTLQKSIDELRLKDIVFFADDSEAVNAGYSSRGHTRHEKGPHGIE